MGDARTGARSASDVEATFRSVYGRAVATLVRVFDDIDLAEDAVQEAFLVAIRRWPDDGIPPNPAGWIVTTARRRAIDRLRRSTRGRQLEELGSLDRALGGAGDEGQDEIGPVSDDRLRLMFTCCHPSLRVEHRVALTLRLLGGLRVDEIARAFLVTESAMAKRLVRAKYKIKAANIPFRVPADTDLPRRLRSVLAVVYLIYNTGVDDAERSVLRTEAIRLGRAIVELMPGEPEALGLLALMLLTEARAPARTKEGDTVQLRDQDRALWDRRLIAEGHGLVRDCIRRNRPGQYQLQAAIQAVHCDAESFETTDWAQIVALYDDLYSLVPTPVVALNRAIAIGEIDGPDRMLELADPLRGDLDHYHYFHAARGAALRALGRVEEARHAFRRAAELATTDRDRRFLGRQVDLL